MRIEKKIGEGASAHYVMSCEERSIADIRALDDGVGDEKSFALVARLSKFWVDTYEFGARPFVKALSSPALADALVWSHPLRARRYLLSDKNPAVAPITSFAEMVRNERKPADPSNPFVKSEALAAGLIEQTLKFWSDVGAAAKELTFLSLYANPFLMRMNEGYTPETDAKLGETLRELPEVEAALEKIDQGGFAEAVIRMLILMARSRGAVRQSRLERSNLILRSTEPFKSLGDESRSAMIHEQTLIIDFEPEAAIAALPKMLPTTAERQRAIALVEEIAGDPLEMAEATARLLLRLRETLQTPTLVDSREKIPQDSA
jgi:tellurite resistance protein